MVATPVAPGTRINLTPDAEIMALKGPLSAKTKALAYVRVSKAREIMFSPEQQLMKIDEYAESHGIEVVDVVEDLNESGRSNNYEQRKIGGIIERIKAGEANSVIVWKYSRFGRSRTKNLVYIELLEEAGGRLISATEIGNENTSTGQLSRGIIMTIDQFQAAQLGETWKETFERRRNDGLPHSGRPRFGYMRCEFCERNEQNNGFAHCEHCKGIFVIDPVRGPQLREMYVRFNAGESLRSLANEMAERGATSVNGTPVKYNAWLAVMDSGFGAGLLRFRSDENLQANASTNLFESWDIWVQGAHPAIIAMDVWEAYKKRRLERQKVAPRARNPSYTFTGLLRCGGRCADGSLCLQVLQSWPQTRRGKRYIYYRCPGRIHTKLCDGVGLTERVLDELAYTWVMSQSRNESRAEAVMLDTAKASEARDTISLLDATIEGLNAKLAKIAKGWVEDRYSDDVYRDLKDEVDEALAAAVTRRGLAEQTLAAVRLGPDDYRPIAENWPHATPREKNEFLRHVVDHFVSVAVEGREPNTCRIVARGDKYDYALPSVGTWRRRGVPTPEAASR